MTAINLNLNLSKSIDLAGLPLEALPPLEAGRTLPQAFADALGKASKSATDATIEGKSEGGDASSASEADVGKQGTSTDTPGQTPVLPGRAPTRSFENLRATDRATESGSEAKSGKALPHARPEIAAPSTAGEPSSAASAARQPDAARLAPEVAVAANRAQAQNASAHADQAAAPVVGKGAQKAIAGTETPDADGPVLAAAPPEAGDKALSSALDASVQMASTPAVVQPMEAAPDGTNAAPEQANVETRQQDADAQPSAVVVATQLVAPVLVQADAVHAAPTDGARHPAHTAPVLHSANASGGIVQAAPANAVQVDGAATQAGQHFTGGEHAAKGDAPADPSARLAKQAQTGQSQPAKPGAEAPQTGLTLQVRAADRAAPPSDGMQAITQASAATGSAQSVVAPLGAPPAAAPTFGVAPQPGAMPHFPELAALVDRIAAARHSAGNVGTSATIAVAHKELGNLSLTFETTGRTLDVEVAAQDSDTQRSLAAAIAADRPHIRMAEAAPQSQGQTLHGQLASAAHGGAGNGGSEARQSGMAGDAQSGSQSDRREESRQSDRHNRGGTSQTRPDPKSDGGIYA